MTRKSNYVFFLREGIMLVILYRIKIYARKRVPIFAFWKGTGCTYNDLISIKILYHAFSPE